MTKRLWFWGLITLFAAALIFWMLYVPFRPASLYRAIPATAKFISVHDNLAERWPDIIRNPLIISVLTSCGVDAETQASMLTDKGFQYWFERLTPRQTVVAYVPSFFREGQQAWVITSWLGGDSQRLKWLLSLTKSHPCNSLERYQGRNLWTIDTGENAAPFYFTLVEGGVIGVLCDDPSALHYLLDMYDGRLPNASVVMKEWAGGPAINDSGIFRAGLYSPRLPFRYALTELSRAAISGTLNIPVSVDEDPGWISKAHYGELGRLLGDLPLATLLVSKKALTQVLSDPLMGLNTSVVNDWSSLIQSDAIMLSILGGDYSGRIKGIKWPAFIAAIPVSSNREALTRAKVIVDELNRKYQWGLILREVPQGDSPSIFIVESTADNLYSKLDFKEQFAGGVRGNWLLLASNTETLMKLCGRYDREESLTGAESGRWRILGEKDTGSCWIDLVEGGKIIRLAISAYSLKLLFNDPRESGPARQRLNEYKAWIDALAPYGGFSLKLRPEEQLTLDLSMGKKQH